jgi:DNA-binding CsgD family transcriptional regulator
MKLDWERDVRPLAEEEARNIRWSFWDRESLAADLLSVSWEIMQGGREFDSPKHVLSVAKLRIRRLVHLDNGHPRSIDGKPMNGEERPKRHPKRSVRDMECRQMVPSAESDGRLAGWLAALTPRQAEVCRALLAGRTMWRIAHDWGISRQSVRITRERAGGRLRKLGVA